MRDFIVITLCAPLASWGAPTTGPIRPCTIGPTKSGITGFLGAALGIERADQESFNRLAADYALGSVVLLPGLPLMDYHTMKRDEGIAKCIDRASSPQVDEKDTNAFLTWRHYRIGYLAVACLWKRNESPLYSSDKIVRFCNEPVYPPYIGRRTCTLSLPPDARLVPAVETGIKAIETAIARLPAPLLEEIAVDPEEPFKEYHYYWEEDFPMGLEPLTRTERHDYPLNNARRQFVSRVEYEAIVRREAENVLEQN